MVKLEQDVFKNSFTLALEAAEQRKQEGQMQVPNERRNHREQRAPTPPKR